MYTEFGLKLLGLDLASLATQGGCAGESLTPIPAAVYLKRLEKRIRRFHKEKRQFITVHSVV